MYSKPEDIVDLVQNAIRGDIKNGNLAYLLLTSKSEHYIRDKVALKLYQDRKLRRKGFLVSREWWGKKGKKKIDLAILTESNKPKVLIEFKLNTVAGGIPGFEGEIKKDIRKLTTDSVLRNASRFIVFMSLLPYKAIDGKFGKLIKYYPGLNGFFKNQCKGDFKKGITEVRKRIEALQDKICKNSGQCKDNIIDDLQVGKFYDDAKLTLFFWVMSLK